MHNKSKIVTNLLKFVKDSDKNINYLELFVTGECQLNCRYCNFNSKTMDMSFETIKDIVDFLFLSNQNKIKIQFFGGEPLLKFDLIKKATSYIKKKAFDCKKEVELYIVTNGILLDSEKINFFEENNYKLVFSFDGLKKIQRKNRNSNSSNDFDVLYCKIVENLKNLANSNIEYFANMVVSPEHVNNLEENVDYLVELGIKNIKISYMLGIFWLSEDIKSFLKQVKTIYLKYNSSCTDIKIGFCDMEPVLVSSGLTVTHNKNIYVGTTFSLLHAIPLLKEINFIANLDDLESINNLTRNKKKEIENALNISKKDTEQFSLIANNIYIGLKYNEFVRYLKKNEK